MTTHLCERIERGRILVGDLDETEFTPDEARAFARSLCNLADQLDGTAADVITPTTFLVPTMRRETEAAITIYQQLRNVLGETKSVYMLGQSLFSLRKCVDELDRRDRSEPAAPQSGEVPY